MYINNLYIKQVHCYLKYFTYYIYSTLHTIYIYSTICIVCIVNTLLPKIEPHSFFCTCILSMTKIVPNVLHLSLFVVSFVRTYVVLDTVMVSKVSCKLKKNNVDRCIAGRKGINSLKSISLLVKTNQTTLQVVKSPVKSPFLLYLRDRTPFG